MDHISQLKSFSLCLYLPIQAKAAAEGAKANEAKVAGITNSIAAGKIMSKMKSKIAYIEMKIILQPT